MELTISGNKKSFQMYRSIESLTIKLDAEMRFDKKASVTILYDRTLLIFPTTDNFRVFADKSKGASKEKIYILLNEYTTNKDFANQILSKGEIELGLFKAIFLIYSWTEQAFSNPYAVNLFTLIYDDFAIDNTGKPQPQQDIYFIKPKYQEQYYRPYLERLVELNLLVYASFNSVLGEKKTYFIPLLKPGVSKQYFEHKHDPTGDTTYHIWKEILYEREIKLSYWINSNKRF